MSNSQTWVTLRSAFSWTRWRQKKRRREWETLQRQQLETQQQTRMLLLQALTPLAEALQRQDQRREEAHLQQEKRLQQLEDLMLEVLQATQPTADQQIFPRIGLQTPPPSSPSWEN